MNVAEDAYFTTQYLDRGINSPRSHSQFKRNGNVAVGTLSPQRVSSNNSEVIDPDTLSEQLTPAQLTSPLKGYSTKTENANGWITIRPKEVPSPQPEQFLPKECRIISARNHMYTQNYTQVQPLQAITLINKLDTTKQRSLNQRLIRTRHSKIFSPKMKTKALNPADTVFVDSENVGILEQNRRFKRAFQTCPAETWQR